MFFDGLKIRHKLIITNITLMLLLIVVIGTVGIRFSLQVIAEDAVQSLKNTTLEYGHKFNSRMSSREDLVKTLATYIRSSYDIKKYKINNSYVGTFKEEITPIVYSMNVLNENVYVFFNPDLDSIAHDIWFFDYDQDGIPERMKEVTKDFYDGNREKDPWFYDAIDERGGVWSKPFTTDMSFEESYFTFSMPVYIDSTFIGIVGSDFVIRFLKDELRELQLYSAGYFSIISDNGEFVVHPQYNFSDTLDTIEDSTILGISEELKGGGITGVIENEDNYLSYYKLRNDWYLISTVPKSDVFAKFHGFIMKLLFATLSVMIISGYFIFRYSKKIIQPIEILTDSVTEIGSGNYLIDLSDESLKNTLEIEELSREIGNMKFKLKNSFDVIELQNTQLDKKVVERTRELTDANKDLLSTLKELEDTKEQIIKSKKMNKINSLVLNMTKELNKPILGSIEILNQISKKVTSTKLLLYNNKLNLSKFKGFMESTEILSEDAFENLNEINEKIEELKSRDLNGFDEKKENDNKLKQND